MGQERHATGIIERIQSLRLDPEIFQIIDLEIVKAGESKPSSAEGVEIESPVGHELFGRDGGGGAYYVLSDGRILFTDSEGSFGIVGGNFEEFIGIATGLPGWHDALKLVKLQSIEVAREKWLAFVDRWGAEEELDEPWPEDEGEFTTESSSQARTAIRNGLGVEPLPDPFGTLYRAIRTLGDDISVAWDGEPATRY